MNEAIQQIVERVWTEHLGIPPEWSGEQAQTYFRTEADRLSEMIGQLQIETQHAVIRTWRAAHQGAEPDYLTQVGLINTARAQAEEIVLSQELYEQIPEGDLSAEEQADQEEWEAQVAEEETYFQLPQGQDPESVRRRSDPDRWRGVYRSEPTEETEAAVERVWPERSLSFRAWMGLLWQSRIEDGNPVLADDPVARDAAAGTPSQQGRPERDGAPRAGGTAPAAPAQPVNRRPRRAPAAAQPSLFDEPFDVPTDPRTIDPGGTPIPDRVTASGAARRAALQAAHRDEELAPEPVQQVEAAPPVVATDYGRAPPCCGSRRHDGCPGVRPVRSRGRAARLGRPWGRRRRCRQHRRWPGCRTVTTPASPGRRRAAPAALVAGTSRWLTHDGDELVDLGDHSPSTHGRILRARRRTAASCSR